MDLLRRLLASTMPIGWFLMLVFSTGLYAFQNAGETKKAQGRTAKRTTPAKTTEPQAQSRDPIGVATMSKDGTITLRLRANCADGTFIEGWFVYPRGHEAYHDILKHIGGLKHGQETVVPPWPTPGRGC